MSTTKVYVPIEIKLQTKLLSYLDNRHINVDDYKDSFYDEKEFLKYKQALTHIKGISLGELNTWIRILNININIEFSVKEKKLKHKKLSSL